MNYIKNQRSLSLHKKRKWTTIKEVVFKTYFKKGEGNNREIKNHELKTENVKTPFPELYKNETSSW